MIGLADAPTKLSPNIVCRSMCALLSRELEPGTISPSDHVGSIIESDLRTLHIDFDAGDLNSSVEDYQDYLLPHAKGLASLLRLAGAWQILGVPLPRNNFSIAYYDGISLLLQSLPENRFRASISFRSRPVEVQASTTAKPILRRYDGTMDAMIPVTQDWVDHAQQVLAQFAEMRSAVRNLVNMPIIDDKGILRQ